MTTRPNFLDMAREWLVRAQGHARIEHEKSLALELEAAWELGIANAIEAIDMAPGAGGDFSDAADEVRKLLDKAPDPRGN